MKKLFSKEVTIGLIVLGALAALIIGIDYLKGINVFKASNYYYVSFTDVAGLAQSAPVNVNGFKVGQVREINYEYDNPGHVKVELALDPNLKVPQGSKAVLTTDILGTSTISLDMAHSTDYHAVGDKLEGVVPTGMMQTVSEDLLPSVGSIMPKVDSLLASVNALVSSPELAASVKRLDAITANLDAMTRHLNAVSGSLPMVVTDVKAITGNFSTMSEDLTAISGELKDVPFDSIARNLAALSANLKELSSDLNNPNSTLGLLTHDPALYQNLNNAVGSLDSLLIDVKKNPKRYISIKLL